MPVKLKDSYTPDSIPVYDMKDGQIGVITEWDYLDNNIGAVVQRHYNKLITVGARSGKSWSTILDSLDEKFRVRLLKRGELIEIQDN